ncbi:polycystin-1-like protein 2 [Branchiostoma floridae x Branchiostoma belcheri]
MKSFLLCFLCTDVDECLRKQPCPENAYCVNQPGTYHCVCLEGFTGNGTTCTEVVPETSPPGLSTAAVQSTTGEYTTPPASSTASNGMSTSSAAPSTASTSLKVPTTTTQPGDVMDPEEKTTEVPSTPTVTVVSHEPPGTSESSPQPDGEGTINTIADLQYDRDNPMGILDQLIPHNGQKDKDFSSIDRAVDSTTCTEAMSALARLSRAPSAVDTTEITAMITSDVITLCETLPLDAQAEGGYVVGSMTDSIKRAALGGASMEELAPKASAVVDTVASLVESGGLEAVSEDEEDIAVLERLPPRKRGKFRQTMKEKLDEKQERQWAYQRDVTQGLQKSLNSIADALLNSKDSTGRVELGSKTVQMVLEKATGEKLGGAAVSAHAGGVTFPGSRALSEGGVVEDADIKVVGYARNPFVWDHSAQDIKSSVLDIELKQPGRGNINVKDLPEDITVVLKNAPDMFPAPRLVKYSPFANDTMVYRTFSARRNQTYGVLLSLVAPYPVAVMYGKLGDFPNETDHEFKEDFIRDDFIVKTVPPNDDVHTAFTVLQPDTTMDNGTEEYTIGVQVDDCPGCSCSVDIVRLTCVFWDPGLDAGRGSWKGEGCRVSPTSTLAHTVCLCNHLTGFGTSAGPEPNRINFRAVFAKFRDLVNNYAVWTTMVVLMGMYFVLLYPARRMDQTDEQKWTVKNVHGNRQAHRSRFLVRVHTGHDWGSGTRSKVFFQLTGNEGSTGPRSFQQDGMNFQSGCVDTFLLTTPDPVGVLTSLTVWHDNTGQGRHASWFLERVEVTDLQTNKRTQFECNDWIGVEHGDGCLRRTLPPTAVTSLGQRFSLKLREKFKDGHVWLSVVTSRPKSYFSRVQRLSCCLCLLFCKMITSAMWFKDSQQGASNVVLTIGPIEVTAETLWVSLWTTLQTFPINFIIVQIFRRYRPKGVSKSSGLQLPHRSVYVGWTLLVLTTLASGFFLLLYSLEWGRDKSIQWLTAFGLSFLQSMVVVQPAEAVIVAFGTTILCACRPKKSETADKDDEDVEAGKRQAVDETLPAQPRIAWPEEQVETEQLKQQRAVRKNWLQLTSHGRQCIVGIIIITAALLMVHETWSPSAPAINTGLKTGFFNDTNSITTQYDVLPWLEDDFVSKLYPEQRYNGDQLDWRNSLFISDMPAYRVGPTRLGQFRTHTDKCEVPLKALHSNKPCVMPYVSEAPGEAPASKNVSFSRVLRGKIGSYSGLSYSVNLGETKVETTEALKVLEANRWIDRHTAALVLDMTLYHPNVNLFSAVSLLFEFPPTGGTAATLHVSTFPLAAQGMPPTIFFVAKAVFVACLLAVVIRLVKKARKEGRSAVLQDWTMVDIASVVTSLYVIVAIALKDSFAGRAKSLISQEQEKEQRSFVDLSDVAFWSDQFTAAVAMVLWFNLVRICSLMRGSIRVRAYLDVLIKIRTQMLGSLVIFILIITGFSMLGYLLFCPYVEAFRSMTTATAGLTFLPWGEVSYDVLTTPSELVGPLFLFTSSFSIMYLLLSFTAAVFVSATSAMMGEKGRGRVEAARQRKRRLVTAARKTRSAVPAARGTLHYCNCDDTNECFGQTHTAESQV